MLSERLQTYKKVDRRGWGKRERDMFEEGVPNFLHHLASTLRVRLEGVGELGNTLYISRDEYLMPVGVFDACWEAVFGRLGFFARLYCFCLVLNDKTLQ